MFWLLKERSDLMKKRSSRQDYEEEVPKAVKKMKKNKNKEIEKENKKRISKKERNKKRRIIMLGIFITIILILGILLGISGHTWIMLAKDMISNESSIVIDSSGNTIAKLRR